MEQEVLETVVSEVLEELKEVKQQMVEILKILTFLTNKAGEVETQVPAAKTRAASAESDLIVAAFHAGFNKIKSLIEAQPKSITTQYRIVLFPEYNSSEYYKIIRKIFLWLLIFTISTYLFVMGKGFIEAYLIMKQNEMEASKYKKVWTFFYHNSKRSIRQKMDSVWRKSVY